MNDTDPNTPDWGETGYQRLDVDVNSVPALLARIAALQDVIDRAKAQYLHGTFERMFAILNSVPTPGVPVEVDTDAERWRVSKFNEAPGVPKLDPEPWVLGNGQRFAEQIEDEMDYICDFRPRPGFSQNESDYTEGTK